MSRLSFDFFVWSFNRAEFQSWSKSIAASRKSSRRTLRSRSSRKGGTDYPDGATGTRMTTASSFSAPIPSEQIPTQEKLNARLSQRKLERGYNDSWKIPNNKDFTGLENLPIIWSQAEASTQRFQWFFILLILQMPTISQQPLLTPTILLLSSNQTSHWNLRVTT